MNCTKLKCKLFGHEYQYGNFTVLPKGVRIQRYCKKCKYRKEIELSDLDFMSIYSGNYGAAMKWSEGVKMVRYGNPG
jgi:hypothetical protein